MRAFSKNTQNIIGRSVSNLRFSFFHQKTGQPLLEKNQTSLANLAKDMDAADVVWNELSPEDMERIKKTLEEAQNSHPISEY